MSKPRQVRVVLMELHVPKQSQAATELLFVIGGAEVMLTGEGSPHAIDFLFTKVPARELWLCSARSRVPHFFATTSLLMSDPSDAASPLHSLFAGMQIQVCWKIMRWLFRLGWRVKSAPRRLRSQLRKLQARQ